MAFHPDRQQHYHQPIIFLPASAAEIGNQSVSRVLPVVGTEGPIRCLSGFTGGTGQPFSLLSGFHEVPRSTNELTVWLHRGE